ncbi:MAG: hypothetical protein KatS3mg129_1156 [Leptospiraceae bacterium]|nr:MAG: hypothetical protein KatS3mg129_1156 [Leptospiraceae bacterium]
MHFILSLHNLFRWLILLVLILIIVKAILDILKIFNKQLQNETGDLNLFLKSKEQLRKFSLILTILVDIQFILGIILYFFQSSLMDMWQEISTVMKQRELRVIIIEHPVLMIIFIALIHYLNVSVKKIETIHQYKKIILIGVISLIILLAGIPWFRPLIRI